MLMGHKVLSSPDHNLAIYLMSGDVSLNDFLACRKVAYKKGSNFASLNQLLVFEAASRSVFTANELRNFARRGSGKKFGSVRIICAPSDLDFGMSRMLAALRESSGDQYIVVRNIEEVGDAIGIPPEEVSALLAGDGAELIAEG